MYEHKHIDKPVPNAANWRGKSRSQMPSVRCIYTRESLPEIHSIQSLLQMGNSQLTATYTSPSDTRAISSSNLPSPPQEGDVQAKTTYLSALRSGITQVQSDVNALLTRKMGEEKDASDAGGKKDERDERAEEMYGEEGGEGEG